MLIRTNLLIVWECANVGLDCKSSAYGLEGSNPSTPTNLMNMLIGFLVFITLELRQGKQGFNNPAICRVEIYLLLENDKEYFNSKMADIMSWAQM